MITKEIEMKVKQNEDVEAIQSMTKLARFCLYQDGCSTCPFYNRDGYNGWVSEYQCMLSRTDNFTPADWNVEMLSQLKEEEDVKNGKKI